MKIVWTEPAIADLESIHEYIARDSEYYANRFIEKIIKSVEKLQKFPKIGRRVPETTEAFVRELLFYNYRIIYKIESKRVIILTTVHGGRDLGSKEQKPWEVT